MKTQISRNSFDPSKRYSGVYQQQGRMITDADWNELVSILKARLEESLRDVVGSGSPRERMLEIQNDLKIKPGLVYAGGIAATFPGTGPVAYASQPDFPGAPGVPAAGEILYADVWERDVSFLEDRDLRDSGLHGADTCTRTQVMVQVKRSPGDVQPQDPTQNPSKGNALLSLLVREASAEADPNDPCATAVKVDQPVGNFLFRVEVHDVKGSSPGAPTEVTLKWSSENGAEAFGNGSAPDDFKANDWSYEFYSTEGEKRLGVHLVTAGLPARQALVAGFPGAPPDPAAAPFVRRWDGHCVLSRTGSTWTLQSGVDRGATLSTGIASGVHGAVQLDANGQLSINLQSIDLKLKLSTGTGPRAFVPGDFWLAPVREADFGDVQLLNDAPPMGIEHRYVRLGLVGAGTFTPERPVGFPLLADLPRENPGSAGASFIGAQAVNNTNPVKLPQGTVASQLVELLTALNAHLNNATNAHAASAITAAEHADVPRATHVQAQLTELLKLFNQAKDPNLGAQLMNNAAIRGAPRSLAAGTVREQLAEVVKHLNGPLGDAATLEGHPAADFALAGHKHPPGDAATLEGHPAAHFALAGHKHPPGDAATLEGHPAAHFALAGPYLAKIFSETVLVPAGHVMPVGPGPLEDLPNLVTFSYNSVKAGSPPNPVAEQLTFVNGPLTNNLTVWVDKLSPVVMFVKVANSSAEDLFVTVSAYRIA
ncbi:DUF6519 domain-containing protein [Archangium lansingense]|uniref:DUF6519 domain-containing protein n=1 Tax=Archangium lansingense TaxID=2995310 RepID=UPI003B76FD1A